MRIKTTGLRPSVLLAAGALALAATTGAVGAGTLITSRQIKDGTVAARDLAPALRAQIKAPGPMGPQGTQGDRGPAGPAGPAGAAGGFDPTKIAYVSGTPVALPAQFGVTFVNADCPAGARAVGGGFVFTKADGGVGTGDVAWSKPNGTSGWTTGLHNSTTADEVGTAYAVCISA